MTQEDKELLLKDISARLPYNVKVKVFWDGNQIDDCIFDFSVGMAVLDDFEEGFVNNIKPYLRSMSSMTKEEFKEYHNMLVDIDNSGLMNQGLITKIVDWLDEKMFDHRGLIPKDLALEAPEEIYKTE